MSPIAADPSTGPTSALPRNHGTCLSGYQACSSIKTTSSACRTPRKRGHAMSATRAGKSRVLSATGAGESRARIARGGGGRVNPEVNEECNRLLASFRLPGGTKLHRQSLHVRSVPVYEGRYPWGKETRRFWIYGHEMNVHAPDYPRSIVRIGLAIGIPLLIVLAPLVYVLLTR